ETGDQFEQFDERRVYGGRNTLSRDLRAWGMPARLRMGAELRHDDIGAVGLYKTRERQRLATVREDAVRQTASSFFIEHQVEIRESLRASAGIRYDRHDFDVRSNLAQNSGSAHDDIVSPKFTLIAGPWRETEVFLNLGRGFHANDARGTTITVDPTDGITPAERVSPLVAARGAEIGMRTAALPRTQLAASVWMLELDSELLYVGDAGFTEPNRASRRRGVELAAYVYPHPWLTIDADLAWSHARFSEEDPAGDRIPNAIDRVVSMGVAFDHPGGWFAGARLRHFGAAPLIEDGSVRSDSTTVVNLKAGYRFAGGLAVSLAAFNLLNARDNDITYFYESQLSDEAAPVADVHFHPIEPRSVRLTLEWRR
ncbi:MAG TPA: TonB-dependent receptor, partial [Steroidobacteraceae bacterium]